MISMRGLMLVLAFGAVKGLADDTMVHKTDECRVSTPTGLCPFNLTTQDGIQCTFSYRILGWVPIDELVGITAMKSTNGTMHKAYTAFCKDGQFESLQQMCTTTAFGCKRDTYSQLCTICDVAKDGCVKAPADFKIPSSSTDSNAGSTHSTTGRPAAILGGCVVAILVVGWIIFRFRCRRQTRNDEHNVVSKPDVYTAATSPTRIVASHATNRVIWEDDELLAIVFGPLLNRGGYGEVYQGTYREETIAIKQLLPDRRKELRQVDAFLREVKLLSMLEHERTVKSLGVAWNALSDVCVMLEYMERGDLRTVLATWDTERRRSQGFDVDKVKIALRVAHALTYLHSLDPMVVHRDLKSKNILLNDNYDAELSDFGVSRQRTDSTMTAGVGSSLWMAPEVNRGERYDEKVDIFSFGIVLSELDTQNYRMQVPRTIVQVGT